ncbi:MAG: trypsin-like peptidase domain-containing protein [Clostridia bacterium]|nr:trypsin-like peptidase domain-containing protein [Clostridia bacterium]
MRKLFALTLIILSLMVLPSCTLSQSDNTSQSQSDFYAVTDYIDGFYEKDIINANFLIEYTAYKGPYFSGNASKSSSCGSGIIFSMQELEDSGVYIYYLLTNNHVVYNRPDYDRFECSVVDCFGYSHPAKVEYGDADYDLAVVSFESSEHFKVLEFALADPVVGDTVASLGSPGGIINSVTVGKVLSYRQITLSNSDGDSEDYSNVQFSVIKHDSYVTNGSSGGALINKDYKICGINYAAEIDGDGKGIHGYAVPLSKVTEFITKNTQK